MCLDLKRFSHHDLRWTVYYRGWDVNVDRTWACPEYLPTRFQYQNLPSYPGFFPLGKKTLSSTRQHTVFCMQGFNWDNRAFTARSTCFLADGWWCQKLASTFDGCAYTSATTRIVLGARVSWSLLAALSKKANWCGVANRASETFFGSRWSTA